MGVGQCPYFVLACPSYVGLLRVFPNVLGNLAFCPGYPVPPVLLVPRWRPGGVQGLSGPPPMLGGPARQRGG
eukprot:11172307-Lingulodinium_polyedra.AAC.1